MKGSIIAVVALILCSSTVFALNDARQTSAINKAQPKTVALEDLSRTTHPVDLDNLPDMQDLHNLDAVYQNNIYGGAQYPSYFQNRNMYSNPLEKRAVIIPGPSVDQIRNEGDIEYNTYIHTERPR